MKGSWDHDRDPLAALARGDVEPFEGFVAAEASSLIGFFRRLGAGIGEAEDLTQEVFLKLYRAAEHYQAREQFTAFCMRIARNAWIDRVRRRAVRPEEQPGESSAERGDAGGSAGHVSDPADLAELREDAERLRVALGLLPETQRLAFEMGVMAGLPYAEVAQALGVPVGTVKSRVFTAVRRLRELLEPAPRDVTELPERRSVR